MRARALLWAAIRVEALILAIPRPGHLRGMRLRLWRWCSRWKCTDASEGMRVLWEVICRCAWGRVGARAGAAAMRLRQRWARLLLLLRWGYGRKGELL